MSTPQKSLFSLLSWYQKFLQSVEIWQSSDKKLVCTVFFETRCMLVGSLVSALMALRSVSARVMAVSEPSVSAVVSVAAITGFSYSATSGYGLGQSLKYILIHYKYTKLLRLYQSRWSCEGVEIFCVLPLTRLITTAQAVIPKHYQINIAFTVK